MECTTGLTKCQQRWGSLAHTIAVLGFVMLTATGVTLESVGNWVVCPARVSVSPGETRGSRRTRDGRTPFVRQEQMAAWFGAPHPVISRWFDYWLRQDWRRTLSQRWGEVLTLEVQHRVIESWVKFPWWSARRVWEHLRIQGSVITQNQVKQPGGRAAGPPCVGR